MQVFFYVFVLHTVYSVMLNCVLHCCTMRIALCALCVLRCVHTVLCCVHYVYCAGMARAFKKWSDQEVGVVIL